VAPESYWREFLGSERQLDTGPLWFAGVLLIFSLAYAGWVSVRRHRSPDRAAGPITPRHLLLIVTVVAPTTLLIRLVYPLGSDSGFTDLNLWEWPGCAALFGLGIVAAGQGWLTAVPDRLRRLSRTVTLATAGAFVWFAGVAGVLGVVEEHPVARHHSARVGDAAAYMAASSRSRISVACCLASAGVTSTIGARRTPSQCQGTGRRPPCQSGVAPPIREVVAPAAQHVGCSGEGRGDRRGGPGAGDQRWVATRCLPDRDEG
jgi:hypothetical protein